MLPNDPNDSFPHHPARDWAEEPDDARPPEGSLIVMLLFLTWTLIMFAAGLFVGLTFCGGSA